MATETEQPGVPAAEPEWEEWTPEAAAAEKDAAESDYGDGPQFYDIKPGRHVVRFLPPRKGTKSPYYRTAMHFLKVLNEDGNEKTVAFECLAKRPEGRTRCPACAWAERLQACPNPLDQNQGEQARAQTQILANVIVRGQENKGVQVVRLKWGCYQDLLKTAADPVVGGNFTHPESGFDILIVREGSGRTDTRYSAKASRQASKLGNMQWIADQYDLSTLPRRLDVEAIAEAMAGRLPPKRGSGRALPPPAQPEVDEWGEPIQRAPAAAPVRTAQDCIDTTFDDIPEDGGDVPFDV